MPERKDTSLSRLIKQDLAQGVPYTFADYMQLALLHPEHGYYARGPEIGPHGDFYTSAALPAFGRALSRFFVSAYERMGQPDGFRVVELGGGTGQLASAVLQGLEEAGKDDVIGYEFVEPAPGLAARQARATDLMVHPGLQEAGPITGVLFANEVLDALPFHRLVGTGDGPRELWVRLQQDEITLEPGPVSSQRLVEVLADSGVTLEPDQVVEVSLVPGALLRAVAQSLRAGYALFIDYGDEADGLYDPPRANGTLRTFRNHIVGDDPFEAPGEQDLTADVDFSQVRHEAREAGFTEAGYVTQGAFLVDLGVAEDYAKAASENPLDALKTKTLFLPGGMGERYKVLALAKGAPTLPTLPGFRGGGFRL